MGSKCDVCGMQATEGQYFALESLPFRGGRCYCANCHARLERRFFQSGLVLDAALGLTGLLLLLTHPGSRFGHCALNLFLIQLFLVGATVAHELAHALVGHWCGLEVENPVVGFGPPLFSARLLGFNFEVKQIPYGGFTRVSDLDPRIGLWRFFLFNLAGPAASALLGVLGVALAGPQHGPLDFTVAISPWLLFSIGSFTLAVHHLVPCARSTPRGRVSSDGLALFQILFQRRVPSVLMEQAAASPREVTVARNLAKRVTVATFATGAFLTFTCALIVGHAAYRATSSAALWLAAVLFALLAATLGWGAFWFYRKPWKSQAPHTMTALLRHQEVTRAFRAEINARSFWPPDSNYDKIFARFQHAQDSGRHQEAAQFLDEAIRWAPDNVALLAWRAILYGAVGQHQEAATRLASLLEYGDLGLSIRATFLAEQIKALLRAGKRQPAWILSGAYLDEPGLVPEKLYLLDSVAALPVQEQLPQLLPDADHWSAQALSMQPENLSLKATRAAVLAELGRYDEAMPLLTDVHTRSEIEADKGLAACYLSLHAREKGDGRSAARFARQARLLHPAPWLLNRLAA